MTPEYSIIIAFQGKSDYNINMKTLLYIDCCIRGGISRTRKIANAFLNKIRDGNKYLIETVVLDDIPLNPLGRREYERREQLLETGKVDDKLFDLPKQFARADLIVVSAPFWDMGIPAKLKIYFENVSVSGFTFGFDGAEFKGLCHADKMVYLTTRGMDIEDNDEMEQASPYLRALCKFFGVQSFAMISAVCLDVKPDEEKERLAVAIEQAERLAESILLQ